MPLVIFIDDSETALASTRMATSGMPIEVKQYLRAQDALKEIQDDAFSGNVNHSSDSEIEFF